MERSRKGNLNCCVKSCKNVFRYTTSEIKFYAFPTANYKVEQRKNWIRWVQKINNTHDWQPKKSTRICSEHFVGNSSSTIQSSPSYIPSISTRKNRESSSAEKSSIQRFDRSMRRRMSSTQNLESSAKKIRSAMNSAEEPQELPHSEEIIEPVLSLRIDSEVQVEMAATTTEHQNIFEGTKTFICAQYILNEICHAQTQAYIPQNCESLQILEQRNTSDESCDTRIVRVDKAIGPDSNLNNSNACTTGFHGISSITKDQEIFDLAGVSSSTFQSLLKLLPNNEPKKISKSNRLLIFLFKMKNGMSFTAIGVLFRVHRKTASRIFFTVLQLLRVACSKFIFWPSRDAVRNTLPDDFKISYKDCRVIVDCIEVKVEQPNSVDNRAFLDSNYKKGSTVKILVGYTPSGLISFISKSYGGRTSDYQITNDSGILDLLQPGDVVLANKGFPGIETALDENGKGALIVIPPFLRDPEFSAEDGEKTYQAANVRIHIERIMQRLRIYKILDKLSIDMLPHADAIFFVCGVLVNLQRSIIKDEDVHETEIKRVNQNLHKELEK